MKKFFEVIINWFSNLFGNKVEIIEEEVFDDTDFSNANFPVIDITAGKHTPATVINGSKLNTPKTPWEDFKNKIKWFPVEEDAFDEWKAKYYPDATINTIEEYRAAWKTFKYQIWGCRVLNVPNLPHDPNFPVLYCIVDIERNVDSNSLSDDIRHWYIDYIHQNYTESEIEGAAASHLQLTGKEHAYWEMNVNPTRKTIK